MMRLFPILFLLLALLGSSCMRKKEPVGYRIAVVPKGTTHEFWEAVHAGAEKAEQDLKSVGIDVEIFWKGPLREDDRDFQIQVVETFASTGYDGIVLAPLDDTALVPPVEMAMRAGIPVVVIDSAINTEEYVSFVATDNYKGGVMAGEHMAELIGEAGDVVLFRYQEGSASTSQREQGFLDAIAKFENIRVISDTEYGGATVDAAHQKAENMLKRPELGSVKGIFCPNETTTVAMVAALRETGRAGGRVKVVGFDTGRQSIVDLRNDDLQALIVQNPMAMGELGVVNVMAKILGKPVERRVDTGVTLITADNMADEHLAPLVNPPIEKYLGGSR